MVSMVCRQKHLAERISPAVFIAGEFIDVWRQAADKLSTFDDLPPGGVVCEQAFEISNRASDRRIAIEQTLDFSTMV